MVAIANSVPLLHDEPVTHYVGMSEIAPTVERNEELTRTTGVTVTTTHRQQDQHLHAISYKCPLNLTAKGDDNN